MEDGEMGVFGKARIQLGTAAVKEHAATIILDAPDPRACSAQTGIHSF